MTKQIFAFSLFVQFVSTVVFAAAPSFNARFYKEKTSNSYAAIILDSAGRCVTVAKLDTDHMFPATTKKNCAGSSVCRGLRTRYYRSNEV